MLRIQSILPINLLVSVCFILSSCFKPPYNNFDDDHRALKTTAAGASSGAVIGAFAGNSLLGTAIGTTAGFVLGSYKQSRPSLLKGLMANDIQYVEYGDTRTLIVPTDRYFVFDTAQLNDLAFPGLNDIAKLIKKDAYSHVYVAAFTDDVGNKRHKNRLSQARAEAMMTFLWANEIPARQLYAEGYGDKHPIANDATIRGSAMNRRLEIQWNIGAHSVSRAPMMDKFGRLVG